MTDSFKSSSIEAESESNAITIKEGMIESSFDVLINVTNIPAIANMQEASTMLTSCNQSYKKLLTSHAESITKLGKEFDDLDKNLSDKMGVLQK